MRAFVSLLCLWIMGLGTGSLQAAPPAQPEKLIFQAGADAFDTLWDNIKTDILEAELPPNSGVKFALKRFRAGGLTVICIINPKDQSKRQCDFYVENHSNAYTDKQIGGVIEFKGTAAKEIAAYFKLKELWHPTDDLRYPGKKVQRAGYAITKPNELFLWEFYWDGKEYFAHFSRIWNPDYYVFDMYERKSTSLFDPRTDKFPKKEIVYVPSPGAGRSSNSKVDDLFLEGMRGSFFGGRRDRAMGK